MANHIPGGITKPYIVNTGTRERKVYACCPCGWAGDTYAAEDSVCAENEAEFHYADRHAE